MSALSPSVFIGAGSWGTRILTDVRAQLLASHQSLDKTPIFGWLCLDFGAQTDGWSSWNAAEKMTLDFDAQNAVELPNAPGGALHRALSDPHLQGGGEVRGRARFGLGRNWPPIEARLRQILQTVTLAESQQKSALVLGPVSRGLNVYIVADLGEVTGGGIATELAFALRSLLQTTTVGLDQVQLIGVLGLPSPAAPSRALANAYAALRELHHWNDPEVAFHAHIAGQVWRSDASQTAFDMAYLWAERNASGHSLNPEQLQRAVVQWLALDLNPDSAPHRASERKLVMSAPALDEWGQCTRYFAAGVAALEFPREALSQAVAANLAAQAWKRAFSPPSHPSAAMCNELVLEWMRQGHLDTEFLLAQVMETPEPSHPLRIGDLAQNARASWAGNLALLKQSAPEKVQEQVAACYGELAPPLVGRHSRPADLPSPSMPIPLSGAEGDLAREVRLRFGSLGEQWRRAAADFSIQYALDAQWGAAATQKLVQIAIERTQAQEKRVALALEAGASAIAAEQSALEACFAALAHSELKKHGGFLGTGLKKRQETLVEQWAGAGATLAVLLLEQQVLGWLRAALAGAGEIWSRPQSELQIFLDEVQEGERLLRKKESDCFQAPVSSGQQLFDARGSGDFKAATRLYAQNIAADAGEAFDLWREVGQKSDSPLKNGAFVALMTRQGAALGDALTEAALGKTRAFLGRITALDLFEASHSDPAVAANRVQELFRAADAYFPLSASQVTPGWSAHRLMRIRRAAFRNAQRALARSGAEEEFAAVLRGLGFSANQEDLDSMLESADGTRASFWSEIGGFPLRSAGSYLSDLKGAYLRQLGDPLAPPLHCREDIGFWLPIEAPSPERQEQLWHKIALGLAFGAVRVQASASPGEARFSLLPVPGLPSSGVAEWDLGTAPGLQNALAASFHPWRTLVLTVDERDLQSVLDGHLEAAAKWPPADLVQKLKRFLDGLTPGAFRSQVSQVFSDWRDQVFAPQRDETRRQLTILTAVLEDGTRAHLHQKAAERAALLQTQLALLGGESEPIPPRDASSELDQLLSL